MIPGCGQRETQKETWGNLEVLHPDAWADCSPGAVAAVGGHGFVLHLSLVSQRVDGGDLCAELSSFSSRARLGAVRRERVVPSVPALKTVPCRCCDCGL